MADPEPLPLTLDVIAEMRSQLEGVTEYYQVKAIAYDLLDLVEKLALRHERMNIETKKEA